MCLLGRHTPRNSVPSPTPNLDFNPALLRWHIPTHWLYYSVGLWPWSVWFPSLVNGPEPGMSCEDSAGLLHEDLTAIQWLLPVLPFKGQWNCTVGTGGKRGLKKYTELHINTLHTKYHPKYFLFPPSPVQPTVCVLELSILSLEVQREGKTDLEPPIIWELETGVKRDYLWCRQM